MESSRTDGRGHWPAGKRRNPDCGKWSRLRLTLSRFLDDRYEIGRITPRALATELGVSDRAVHRWLSGQHRPSEEYQLAIEQWLKEKRGRK